MVARTRIDVPLTLALSPLLAAQALWVRRRALQLPEPDGVRTGQIGSGPDLRLLVIGDSSAAGVGVMRQEQALTPQLAANLADGRKVTWHLAARNGATTADAPGLLAPLKGEAFDLAYVIFGVNDAKDLRSERAWRRDLSALTDTLKQNHGAPRIFFSGLPPIRAFPLLPEPLRSVLSLRAQRFDHALQKVARRSACHHLPIDVPLDPAGMAEDGFHPGAGIYTTWAEHAAIRIARHL
ncbi:SGNH/GDSL hydrolase family protein [Aliishimia ponticola]|nr:SGNH/GDSL hydrolase family protein [Aliishimia ponticola]